MACLLLCVVMPVLYGSQCAACFTSSSALEALTISAGSPTPPCSSCLAMCWINCGASGLMAGLAGLKLFFTRHPGHLRVHWLSPVACYHQCPQACSPPSAYLAAPALGSCSGVSVSTSCTVPVVYCSQNIAWHLHSFPCTSLKIMLPFWVHFLKSKVLC